MESFIMGQQIVFYFFATFAIGIYLADKLGGK